MSFQSSIDGRDRSRLPTQASHQTWIPRASTSTVIDVIPPSTFNRNHNLGGGRMPDPESRGHVDTTPIRGHMDRPVNRRKENRSMTRELKDSKDPNVPQLVQEIQEKLAKSTVECMICYDMVRRSAPIWSCSSCFSIFHLNCIKKWACTPTSVDLSAEKNQGFNWRCPGCQSVQLTSSKEIRYICFCGKRTEPPSDLYLTPHSCGESCGKPLEREVLYPDGSNEDPCPHACVLQCHPGPCPPCKAFAPPRLCPCGKKTITTRCSDQKSVLTCGQPCGKLLACLRHQCERTCHVGPCDPCQVLVNASCFCKKKAEVVSCGDMVVKGEVKGEDGVFSCSLKCGKLLGCGNHLCGETCHTGLCGNCELMPGVIKSCYCGKTSLLEERQSCLDPIPICSKQCDKTLPCRIHHCKEVCHPGDCSPCLALITQKCRCGSTSQTVECYKTSTENEKFKCEKPCGLKKNCRRHRCSERCCPLSNPNVFHSGDMDPHGCQMACGKKLRCGKHACESLCHSGHCPPCLESIFIDLSCACGKTSIPPPLPCGTPFPSCQLPCSVPQPCGHPTTHSCHFGDCPPCSVPIAKECVGGHVVLGNIPCGSRDIRCNKLCGKTRQCGLHACGRICHPSPCDSSSGVEAGIKASCGQKCGGPRRDCRHTCSALCHPSAPCPDERCEFPVTITCSCGRIRTTVPCDAGGSNSGFWADSVFEASIVQKLPVPLQAVELTEKKIPLGQRKLMCDDECAKMERKRVLADAFDISSPNLEALHFGENSAFTELISDLYRRDPKWVLAVEERCKYLVLCRNRGASSGVKIHVFCPMLKDKRDVVRLIADRWKLSIFAAGREPKRFVVVHVTPKSKVPPRVIGVKGTTSSSVPHLPAFDPLVDMDPRLVVSFMDVPRESDVSSLVLRFGGECELVWLNDKNSLAVFSDPARAATAMRRLDHASAYRGAIMVLQNAGSSVASSANNAWAVAAGKGKEGGISAAPKGNPWKKASSRENSWGSGSVDIQGPAWTRKGAPISASVNRWTVLESEATFSSSSAAPVRLGLSEVVVDDWEKAYDYE